VHRIISAAVKKKRPLAPAGEWLLDNFPLILEQIRTARRHLPRGYCQELPHLRHKPSNGLPRVYDLALELISHLDGKVDRGSLHSFVAAYQSVIPLKLGELWAIPIMLRLALIENLRRVATRIASGRHDRDSADHWADRLVEVAEKDPKSLIVVLADWARSEPILSSAFVAELTRRLQGQNPAVTLALTWVEQRLNEQGHGIERLVEIENTRQAADQASIGNSINSLRLLSAVDWREFVEAHSAVERALRQDPAEVHSLMTFATRDRYRHVVESIARRSQRPEDVVAQACVALARAGAAEHNHTHRAAHVGFYLIDAGVPQLERAMGVRTSPRMLLASVARHTALFWYIGSIALLSSVAAFAAWPASAQHLSVALLVPLALLFGLAFSQLSVTLVNLFATLLVKPTTLPRMDFSKGIPLQARTLVVVPTLLSSPQVVVDLLQDLEVRYLANRSANLYFALLTDFPDGHGETTPSDEKLLRAAAKGIATLNRKHADSGKGIFLLLHRPRRWNARAQVWMGEERKRGKLSDLNDLLRGRAAHECFSLVAGPLDELQSVQFVITVDTDTQLPRDSAWQLAGTLAHPLNRARYDATQGRVVAGYGIVQPRAVIDLPSAAQSRFAGLCSGDPGIDPYTREVSDVYQDLFQEGSFIGKGIYDVDAFRRTFAGRLPDNLILSHDLLEGCYVRSALASDVVIYEGHPATYSADVQRRHRWIRGDWQILGWLFRTVPNPGGQRVKNPLSWLSQWKIFDNLRRSLVAPALLLLLMLGWTCLGETTLWSLLVAGIAVLPALLNAVLTGLRKPRELSWGACLRGSAGSMGQQFAQAALTLAFLPYEAFYSLDAVVRTCVRLFVTRRNRLEWTTAAEATRCAKHGLRSYVRRMWIGPALALLAFALPGVPVVTALPFVAAWLLSPLIAWRLSRPRPDRIAQLSETQQRFLRKVARRTWAFFDTFVCEEEHWLPPDNHQVYPQAMTAHRTSPTNMGMALLANLSAHDFGYISARQLSARTRQTLHTLSELKRFRGHFYNWYDTRSLQPLPPLYVSSVDSGNLAAMLLTLRAGLLELSGQPVRQADVCSGLRDTLDVLADSLQATHGREGVNESSTAEVQQHLTQLRAELQQKPQTLVGDYARLQQAAQSARNLASSIADGDAPVRDWALALERQACELRDELLELVPWVALALPPAPAPDESDHCAIWRQIRQHLERIPTLREVAQMEQQIVPLLDRMLKLNRVESIAAQAQLLSELRRALAAASRGAGERIVLLEQLARQCGELADMEYDFLLDETGRLLTIGYNVSHHRRDSGSYDLLASEARLGSFLAIAQGRLPQEHWFALGRLLTAAGDSPALLSWSGSMFEYLMPLLVMPSFPGTLLDQTCRAVVRRQIEYGREHSVPWGVSESAYNTLSAQGEYQYSSFGVPGLGYKRGLSGDLVVAPYASALALMVAPEAACINLERLAREGFSGFYGFYDAIDYTKSRLRRGQPHAIVQTFMAHHQGMTLLSLAHVLLGQPMQRRFLSDPLFQASVPLLYEKIPKTPVLDTLSLESAEPVVAAEEQGSQSRSFTTPHTPTPEVHLLSNGRYSLMVTAAGGGYSRWNDVALTRWREDATRDNWGLFCYIQDAATGRIWSNAYQPTLQSAKHYEAIFSQARAEFRRHDSEFETLTDIAVSPEDDIELRRIRITNNSNKTRTLVLTSYAEVVLAPSASEATHPAYANLFVQTELLRDQQAILCTRRPRSAQEHSPCLLHLMTVHGSVLGKASFETDRAKFVGRGRSTADPAALDRRATGSVGSGMVSPEAFRLSDSAGAVLDPIVSIRNVIVIRPEETVIVDLVLGVAATREAALVLAEKYRDRRLAERVFELAWTHRQVVLQQLNATEPDAQLYGRLASSIVYSNPLQRAAPSILAQNARGQSGLWSYGISGDQPIVLLRISDQSRLDLVRQLVQAHAFWRLSGLAVDLVIWNEERNGYRQGTQDEIMGVIGASSEAAFLDKHGGIFVRIRDQLPEDDRILLQTVARVIIADSGGTLAEQAARHAQAEARMPWLRPTRTSAPRLSRRLDAGSPPAPNLIFFNGLGGFTPDGREYVITLNPSVDTSSAAQNTPAPWVNVLANPVFGTVVSESGGAYTWRENAHEFRLTSWSNDPVGDCTGEALYIRDEDSGRFWSPTSLPKRGQGRYVCRHGFGYSIFEHTEDGIASELCVYVAKESPVKFMVLKLRNHSVQTRHLSATAYVEWVLGEQRTKSLPHVLTEVDPQTGAIFARNAYNTEFRGRVAFLDAGESGVGEGTNGARRSVTGDRTEFIGRNGNLANPAAMERVRLAGKVGAGLDPCGAVQVPLELGPGEEREIVFTLGAGFDADEARSLLQRFRGSHAARSELEAVWEYWKHTLGAVYVETPDAALNVLTNGWLLYQTLACRVFGRSGFYQSGGGYGFRDQLQDVLALLHTEPRLIREQLLRCAERQFPEGDVQHWWHPPLGRGTRTRCSDDYLWLPLVASIYVRSIGDTGILDEPAGFLASRPLQPDEQDYYDLPAKGAESAPLYDHCVRAIKHGLKFGAHGLPLMGNGDWNDALNHVGAEGKGESVWLAFFLYYVLTQFAAVARARGDTAFVGECLAAAHKLRENIEREAWDGDWYVRAFFDNGEALGSVRGAECQIDSIAQSWAVLSGAGAPERCSVALGAAQQRLVRTDARLVQLFVPPFDRSPVDPGYIKGYVPGVRENGGQYTHAAVWLAMAQAIHGEHERAWQLLQMLNPINHGATPEQIATYRVEPYVVAGDVYAVEPHVGRGGWTWYTGAAGWMYQLIVEAILGLKLGVQVLRIAPRLPAEWPTLKVHYRYRETFYHISIEHTGSIVSRVTVDGVEQADLSIPLRDDRIEHTVEVQMS
jgi:cellobiose phosphorylase